MMAKKRNIWILQKIQLRSTRTNTAVSAIVGTVLLLLIAVGSMSVIYITILSDQGPGPRTYVDIVGTVEGNYLVLEHRGGESLPLDTEIKYSICGVEKSVIIGDVLDGYSKENGAWDLGESLFLPISYSIENIDSYNEADVIAIDKESNSIAFMGKIELHPMSDIGIEINVDPDTPIIETNVNVTVTVTCLGGDVGAADIEISCLLPHGLIHVSNTTTRGVYSNSSGVWYIDQLDIWESATLRITATVQRVEVRVFTQIAMILDGSGSIDSSDWGLMRTGLANAIEDSSIFPHDGSAELTVIQFGIYPNYCSVEIPPTIVNNTNFQSIANTIKSLSQGNGGTPMAAGIYLTSDTIEDSIHFDKNNRQIITLVTDGKPTYYSYEGEYFGRGDGTDPPDPEDLQTTEDARDYLVAHLNMTEDQDEFDALAVGGGPDIPWLNSSIVWPPPGYIWDDLVSETPPGPGWVSQIGSWNDFSQAVNEIFNIVFNSIKTSVEITKLKPSDPNTANDYISASIIPQDE
jgi:hypothetical protein